MLCIACGESTEFAPCRACGDEPRLDGRWSLLEVLGQGANGTTYKAVDGEGRTVAAKESTLKATDPDKVRELVQREARVLRQLTHDGVPSYVEELWHQHGRSRSLFLLQEFVQGVDLERRLVEHRYDEAEVLDLLDELAGILAHLHGRQPPIVHRDVKPSNVMRRPDGHHVLIDFGSVRDVLKDVDLGGSTVAGTFGYMAPEQFAGDASPQSDLYALGAVAVALLTRQDPARLQRPDRSVGWHDHAAVSPEVTQLIDELLSLEPSGRPASAEAVRARIAAIRDGSLQPAVAPSSASVSPSTRSGPAAPLPVKTAEYVADEPEAFHQPPVPHHDAPLGSPATGRDRLPFVAVTLLVGGLAAGLVTALLVAILGGGMMVAKAPAPPRAPPVADAGGTIYRIPDSPWPVMALEQLEQIPAEPTCDVTRMRDQSIVVRACPEPLVEQATSWAEEQLPAAPEAYALGQTLAFQPRPDASLLTPAVTVVTLDETAQGPYVARAASEMTALHRGQPSYPEAAKSGALAPAKCVVEVEVGADGAPDTLTIRECPLPFHANTQTALSQWRWDVGEPRRTTIGVTYRFKGD